MPPSEPEFERLGTVPAERMTPEHRAAKEAFKNARGTDVFGPFLPLLWSPELMLRLSALGDYLRYQSAFPPHLSEFMILIASRVWSQQYEWSLHRPIALQVGVARHVVDAIAEGRRPRSMSEEQEILYDFAMELGRHGTVSELVYERAVARFGERGVIDAVGIVGYYTLLAMVLNTARTPPEPGTPALPPVPANDQGSGPRAQGSGGPVTHLGLPVAEP
jgi:4-carboxymuconolactone decarboxylase